VWRPESLGEIGLESVDGVPAVAVRNLDGKPAAEFHTAYGQSPATLRVGQRYKVKIEYQAPAGGSGRFDLRFGDTSKPGPFTADFHATNGGWQFAEATFEPPSDGPLAIYVCNWGVGKDKTIYVRSVEVSQVGAADLAP
jgi:hypothetical protein